MCLQLASMQAINLIICLLLACVCKGLSQASGSFTQEDLEAHAELLHIRRLLANSQPAFSADTSKSHRLTPFLLKLGSKSLPELQDESVLKVLTTVRQLGESDISARHLQDVLKQVHLAVSELRKPGVTQTYPVTRRITLGIVFDAHTRLKSWWTRSAQAEVYAICFEFYKLYREAARNMGVVQFQHISKCGGTSMCQAAKQAGCTTQEFSMSWNCRIKDFGDTPLWSEKSITDPTTGKRHFPFFSRGWPFRPSRDQLDNCAERAKYLKETGFNFFANELYLVEGLVSPVEAKPCSEFLNVIILRRPLPRVLSNLKHIAAYYLNMHSNPPSGLKAINETAPAVIDNYSLRMLLGHWVYDIKLGGINEAHLELARLKLQQFDLVLLLEEPDTAHVLMRYGLGWNTTLRDISPVNVGSKLTAVASPELGLNAEDIKVLEDLNQYETSLYEFGKSLQAIDVAWLEAAWKTAKASHPELLSGIDASKCGYVSM